ncbi:transporter substrate-binding domain-containing protein [Shewanella sp. VB17]|uniref:substrate-binding periplasmic protein n=1 Tax=Shewanella sp. VB17 TaxID=2739432 RepID=UPI001563BA34|nr:transporter substrate-binding domain-containing protein [Shewanella sp. VB17]NRD71880.1 transporter substrate-binding domain-containing protein [Shewanella sp. VB17]
MISKKALFFIISIPFSLVWSTYANQELKIYAEDALPLSFINKQGEPDGLAVKVVEDILKRIKSQSIVQVVPWARGWLMVSNEPNSVLFTMSHSSEREEKFTLLGPLMIGELNLYSLKSNNISFSNVVNIETYNKIALLRSGICTSVLNSSGINVDFTHVTNDVQAVKMTAIKRVDYFCSFNYLVANIINDAGYNIDQFTPSYLLQNDKSYIAFSKGTNVEIIKLWQKAMIEMIEDGTMKDMFSEWLPGVKVPDYIEILGGSLE